MKSRETRQYAMLVRVRDFGDGHQALFTASTIGGQAFATVAAAVAQLSVHAKSKMVTPREGRASKKSARLALIQRIETIGRTAAVIAEQAPGFDDPFRLPELWRESDEMVLTVGRAFVRDAEGVKDQFIAHAMPDTFAAHLQELVDRFEEAVRGQEGVRTAQTAAQSGIGAAIESGLNAVRLLDVLVANQLQDDAVALAVWRQERRIGRSRKSRSRRGTAQPVEAPTAPPPVDSSVPLGGPVATAPPTAVAAPAVAEPKQPTAPDVHLAVAS